MRNRVRENDFWGVDVKKVRRADFSFGFRPVDVEVETVHRTGKVGLKSAAR